MAVEVTTEDRFCGAMLGSAIGDAFGYPLTPMTYEQICERFEELGAMELAVSSKTKSALFTDATQMALFTADGMMWAAKDGKAYDNNACASYVFYSYQLWLYTQTKTVAGKEYGWLFDKEQNPNQSRLLRLKGLTKKRNVLDTNINALFAAKNNKFGRLTAPVNNNTDNCALKRSTPVGLFYATDSEMAFRMGCDFGAITHSHPDGYLPCGVYAAMIAELTRESTPEDALDRAMEILQEYPNSSRVYNMLAAAKDLAADEEVEPLDAVRRLGTGVEAAECLAISVLCMLIHKNNFKFAIELAANHDGDSSACGAVTGGLMGAYYGEYELPVPWIKKLQYQNLIVKLAVHLYDDADLEFAEQEYYDANEDDYIKIKPKRKKKRVY